MSERKTLSAQEALQEERYLWMTRAFSFLALLAFIANMMMLLALEGLTPLLRVQSFYLHSQDKDAQVISVSRPNIDELNREVLEESLVREYVLARYTIGIDFDEVSERWGINGIVNSMSSTSVYNEFNDKEAFPSLERIKGENLTREVIINSAIIDKRIPKGNIWAVKMQTIERSSQLNLEKTLFRTIKMQVDFEPKTRRMQWTQRLKNPLGFTVKNFGVTKGLQE